MFILKIVYCTFCQTQLVYNLHKNVTTTESTNHPHPFTNTTWRQHPPQTKITKQSALPSPIQDQRPNISQNSLNMLILK